MRQVNVNSIGDYIREQREQAKISLRQLSQAAGVSNPYLSQIERGLRKPSADILQQIAKGLRISAEALYVQAGILEDRPADSGVRSALLADPGLAERQKQVLIEIYESFRKENSGGGKADGGATGEAARSIAGTAEGAAAAAVADGSADTASGTGWPFQAPAAPDATTEGAGGSGGSSAPAAPAEPSAKDRDGGGGASPGLPD